MRTLKLIAGLMVLVAGQSRAGVVQSFQFCYESPNDHMNEIPYLVIDKCLHFGMDCISDSPYYLDAHIFRGTSTSLSDALFTEVLSRTSSDGKYPNAYRNDTGFEIYIVDRFVGTLTTPNEPTPKTLYCDYTYPSAHRMPVRASSPYTSTHFDEAEARARQQAQDYCTNKVGWTGEVTEFGPRMILPATSNSGILQRYYECVQR